MKITIENSGTGFGWIVTMGERSCRNLCWDEMLGQVARITLEMPPIYPMKTESEWDEHGRRIDELNKERGLK